MNTKVKPAGETDVNYDKVIVQLDECTRVIEDKAGLQYILQTRTKAAVANPTPGCYYSKAFARRRTGVEFVCKERGFKLSAEELSRFKVILL